MPRFEFFLSECPPLINERETLFVSSKFVLHESFQFCCLQLYTEHYSETNETIYLGLDYIERMIKLMLL